MKPHGSPRRRLVQASSTQSTGAGGNTIVTVTPPFGRKWRLVSAMCSIDEAGKAIEVRISDASGTISLPAYIASCASGVSIQYPCGELDTGSTGKNIYGLMSPQWIEQGGSLKFIVYAASASKTITYRYSVEEFADDGHSASPT